MRVLTIAGAVLAAIGAQSAFAADATPTYTKDIAPIFQAKCENCHRADGMGPMKLSTYEDARPWVRSIAQRVGSRQMPPWHIDKTVGIQKFKNDRSLSDAQIATIVKWVDAGAPLGNPEIHRRLRSGLFLDGQGAISYMRALPWWRGSSVG